MFDYNKTLKDAVIARCELALRDAMGNAATNHKNNKYTYITTANTNLFDWFDKFDLYNEFNKKPDKTEFETISLGEWIGDFLRTEITKIDVDFEDFDLEDVDLEDVDLEDFELILNGS